MEKEIEIPGVTYTRWENGKIEWEAFDYGFLTLISEVKLEKAADLANQEIALEDILEARIFNEASELHLWRENGELRGVKIEVGSGAKKMPFENYVSGRFSEIKRVKGCKLLAVDEDGQAFIAYTKLDSVQN